MTQDTILFHDFRRKGYDACWGEHQSLDQSAVRRHGTLGNSRSSHVGTCHERAKFGHGVCEVVLLEERGDVLNGVDAVVDRSYARQEIVK